MYVFECRDQTSALVSPYPLGPTHRSGAQNFFARANQFLPGYWTHLSVGDLERITRVIDGHLRSKTASTATLEACVMVEGLLSTGRHFDDLFSVKARPVTERGSPFHSSPPGLLRLEGNWSWWLPAGGPKRGSPLMAGLMKPTVPNVFLPVTVRFQSALTRLLRQREGTMPLQPTGLFKSDETWLVKRCRAILASRVSDGGNARRAATTIESAERWLLSAISHAPGGDLNAASTITARTHSVARPTTHYGSVPIKGSVETYRRTISQLSELSHETFPASLARFSVGDPATPSDGAVTSLIADLTGRLDDVHAGLNEIHAAMTEYTVALISFALALRGTGDVPGFRGIDAATGFANISDKSSRGSSGSRMLWVCEMARQQMAFYEDHLDRLHNLLRDRDRQRVDELRSEAGSRIPLLRLDPRGGLRPLSVAAVFRSLKRHGWPGEANAGRHWIRAKLVDRCSHETLAAFMGHGQAGAYAFAPTSCLDPLIYKADLHRSLDRVMRKGGWQARPSPLSKPRDEPVAGRLPFDTADVLPYTLEKLLTAFAPDHAMTPGSRAGQLLASAIFHGALLDRRYWSRWLEAAFRGPVVADDLVWLDLDPLLPEGHGAASQPRRWFADPVTRTLLGHWWGRKGAATKQPAEECIAEYLSGDTRDQKVVDILLESAERRWRLRMPPLVFGHSAGLQDGVPPSGMDWLRILNFDVPQEEREERARENRPKIWCAQEVSLLKDAQEVRDPRLKLRMKQSLAGKIELLDCAGPGHELLNRWCRDALALDRGRQQDGLMPSTIRSYLGCLCEHVVSPDDDLAAMTADHLLKHLWNSLSRMEPSSRRGRTLDAVRSLYAGMRQQRRDLPPLAEEFSQFSFHSKVSARLMSPAEFQRALNLCRTIDQQICLILGFRCGLRLPEVLGLVVDDFSVSANAFELTVIRNRLRDLKTFHSRRVIPLHALLEGGEVALLKDRIASTRREEQVAARRDPFLMPRALMTGVPEARSPKAAIETIIREATGAQLTYHHLRHSFASYMITTLLLPDDLPDAPVPHSLKSVISPERKARVAAPLLGREKLGQHALHSVSQLMGHIVNETTVHWYGHLLDLVRLHYVSRPSAEAALPRQQVLRLNAISRPLSVEVATDAPLPAEDQGTEYRRPIITRELYNHTTDHSRLLVSEQRGRRARGWESRFVHPDPRLRENGKETVGRALLRETCWRRIFADISHRSPDQSDQSGQSDAGEWRKVADRILSLTQKSGAPRHVLPSPLQMASPNWIFCLDARWPADKALRKAERRALFSAIERWDPSRDGVRFAGRPGAVTFVKLLRSCGFANAEIEIKVTGAQRRECSPEKLHSELESADWLPGTARTRGRRGSIGIHLKGGGEHKRHLRSAGHFMLVMLAVREGYGEGSSCL